MPDAGNQGNQPGGTSGGGAGTGSGMQTGDQGNQQQNQQNQAPTFESWLAGQDEATKALLDNHTKGLKSALDSERAQHSDLAKQVKELTGKVEKGSDAEKALNDLTSKLEAAELRASFFEEATKSEVGCTNPTLAFLLARDSELFDRRGNPDWEAIRKAAPELFRVPGQQQNRPGSADGGAGGGQQRGFDMNTEIRRRAGYA